MTPARLRERGGSKGRADRGYVVRRAEQAADAKLAAAAWRAGFSNPASTTGTVSAVNRPPWHRAGCARPGDVAAGGRHTRCLECGSINSEGAIQ